MFYSLHQLKKSRTLFFTVNIFVNEILQFEIMLRSILKTLKKHAGLIPLYLIVASGVGGAGAFAVHSALHNPDVQWDRRKKDLPNEEYRAKMAKLYSPSNDYTPAECPAPKYHEFN